MATLEEVARVVGALKLAYPNFGYKLEEGEWTALTKTWHRLLCDLPFRLIDAAAMHYATTSNSAFPPSVAELREMAYRLANPNELSAEEAWGRATRLVAGAKDDDPLINEAVRIMGWSHIRMRLEEDEHVNRAHFFRIYEMLRNRQRSAALMLPEVRETVFQLRVANGNLLRAGRDEL